MNFAPFLDLSSLKLSDSTHRIADVYSTLSGLLAKGVITTVPVENKVLRVLLQVVYHSQTERDHLPPLGYSFELMKSSRSVTTFLQHGNFEASLDIRDLSPFFHQENSLCL